MNRQKLEYIVLIYEECTKIVHSEDGIYVRSVLVPNEEYQYKKRKEREKEKEKGGMKV